MAELHEYDWDFRVNSYDSDAARKLKISSIMSYNQEAGGRALEQYGVSYEKMYDMGVILVFTQVTLDIKKIPIFHDELHLNTWHRGSKGVQFFRDTEITDQNGNLMVGVTISCCCINPLTRNLLRPQALLQFGITADENRLPKHRQPIKIKFSENINLCGERIVRYSDLDYNGHMNNAVYADICLDQMPERLRKKQLKYLTITYLGENLEGDMIKLYSEEKEDGIVLFRGENPRTKSFEAHFEFEK